MVAQDGFGSVLRIVFLLTSIFVLLFTLHSRELAGSHPGELTGAASDRHRVPHVDVERDEPV